MSMENPLWGAPRIHGELLKLGFEVAQSSVAKHMEPHSRAGPTHAGNISRVSAFSRNGRRSVTAPTRSISSKVMPSAYDIINDSCSNFCT
jgi:hypothetical protein